MFGTNPTETEQVVYEIIEQPEPSEPGKTRGKVKIPIAYIKDKAKRQVCFSKRKAGLIKKAQELSKLTSTETLLIITNELGQTFTFSTRKFRPIVNTGKGLDLLNACLSQNTTMGEAKASPVVKDCIACLIANLKL